MFEVVEANWLLILIALLIGLAIAWYIFNVRRRTRVQGDRRDVLDEGAERAKRNQAFLDAPGRPVADTRQAPSPDPLREPREQPRPTGSPPLPGALGGAGTAVNAAAGTPQAINPQVPDAQDNAEAHDSRPSVAEPKRSAAPPVQPTEQATAAPVPATPPPASPPMTATSVVEPTGTTAGMTAAGDLTRLKGIGPKLAARLNELGVTRLDQIAGWSDSEIDRIDAQLDRFQGRIRRDDWVTQARLLAAGDEVGYQERFGRV